mgnify:CR=1 FL=1
MFQSEVFCIYHPAANAVTYQCYGRDTQCIHAPLARKREVEHIGDGVLEATQDENHDGEDDEEPRLRLAVVIHRQIHHRTATYREQKNAQRRILQLGRDDSGNIHRVACELEGFGHNEGAHEVARDGYQ